MRDLRESNTRFIRELNDRRAEYHDETAHEKKTFKEKWEKTSGKLEALHGEFKELVDRERDLWFGEEFKHVVKKMKLSDEGFL